MSKIKKAVAALMLMTVAMAFAVGCGKQENTDDDVKVTTYAPQDITLNSAKCGGDAIVVQGLSLTEIGVCWSTERNPTVKDRYESSSNWNEPFVCVIDRLSPGTTYHVRAFALRGMIYYYGEDMSFTTEEYQGAGDGVVAGHDYIDLGLPSGILWAVYNGGAQTYQNESSNPAVVWGGGWRQPSKDEWEELCQNTTCIWTTQNGINGRLFTAANGKSIFLQAAGNGHHIEQNGSWVSEEEGISGYYWSNTIVTGLPPEYVEPNSYVWGLKFDSDGYEMIHMFRGDNHNFRLVHSGLER